ncbi:MAG TPA: hypothetical protein VMR33_23270 [Candidatus Baltobacteraceae bacterium]|jgi:hypothetical protein|nr:hypothetical protein [Candidatus Baltobacteraceae bacterium]
MNIKLIIAGLTIPLLGGCLADPLMTGHPQDWKGHMATELQAAIGPPTQIVPRPHDEVVWEYIERGDFVSPKEKNTGFSLGGSHGFGAFGASGGIKETENNEHMSRFETCFRYEINKDGKIVGFYGFRTEDGKIVHEEH